jgi:hypothetical protein
VRAPPFQKAVLLGQIVPLANGVLAPHGQVASAADWLQVVQVECASLALGNVVAHMVVEHAHGVAAPLYGARGFECATNFSDPDLLTQGLGNLLFDENWAVRPQRTFVNHDFYIPI